MYDVNFLASIHFDLFSRYDLGPSLISHLSYVFSLSLLRNIASHPMSVHRLEEDALVPYKQSNAVLASTRMLVLTTLHTMLPFSLGSLAFIFDILYRYCNSYRFVYR